MATGKVQDAGLIVRIKRPFQSTGKFLRDVYNELQRVVWPSHEETYGYTIVVLVAVLIVATWVGLWDLFFTHLVRLLGMH